MSKGGETGPVVSPQVGVKHYFRRQYDSKARWTSYWHQAHEVLESNPVNCLEIGAGNGTVRSYLRAFGIDVLSVDIDPALGPDRVGDVRALPCSDEEFDVVLCAEVLEHLPFDEVPGALDELRRVCRRRAVVSVPHTGRFIEVALRIPPLPRLAMIGKLPNRHDFVFDGQHYWEVGARNYPARRIREAFQQFFAVTREYLVPENPYHHFYILDRK